jgi:hypothetical protein
MPLLRVLERAKGWLTAGLVLEVVKVRMAGLRTSIVMTLLVEILSIIRPGRSYNLRTSIVITLLVEVW